MQSWVWRTLAIIISVIAALLLVALVLKKMLNRKLLIIIIANWAITTAISLAIFMYYKDAPLQLPDFKVIDFANMSNATEGMEKAIKSQKHDLRAFHISDYGIMAEVAGFSMRFSKGACESLQFSLLLTKDFLSYIKPFMINGEGVLFTSGKEKTHNTVEQTLTIKAHELKGFLAALDNNDWTDLIGVGESGNLEVNYNGNMDIVSAVGSENTYVIANGELTLLDELDIDALGIDGMLYPFFVAQTDTSSVIIIYRS
ncbi:MAG: hypothetical protein LBT59_20055 [Clostridiales bacterium]|nr:hypothetical protein [Clostridiales bacterium]